MGGVLPYQGRGPTAAEAGAAATQRVRARVHDAPAHLRAMPATVLRGEVIGDDPQGHLLVRSAHGVIALASRLRPPRGSTVTLQLRPVGARIQAYILHVVDADGATLAQPAPALPAGGGPGPSTPPAHDEVTAALTRLWPALDEALAVLAAHRGSEAGLDALARLLPQPGPRLALGVLFTMAALLTGDPREWLRGSIRRALAEAGREDVTAQLDADFERLSRLAGTDSRDWRLFVVPVLAVGHVHPLRLFLRPPAAATDADADAARRFVVELELPHLGPLQLDGLVRPPRLELILRGLAPLAPALREELQRMHARMAAITGLSGQLRFASGADWRFLPIPGDDGGDDQGVVI